jgi:glucose-fructose oxidoreductase
VNAREQTEHPVAFSRRVFLQGASASAIGLAATQAALGQASITSAARGQVEPKLVDEPEPSLPPERRVRWAVVGLGKLAFDQILPSFGRCKSSRLTALVSGNREKALKAAQQHGIDRKNVYSYDNFDEIARNDQIDVVYIILPNSLHAEYSARASKAGKHVFCEKPMAVTAEECERMIQAANAARKKLMIGYRCQYEPCNLAAVNAIRNGEIGDVRVISVDNGRAIDPSDPADQWRLKKSLAGGGSLMDIGIYGVNGMRYLIGEEPIEVSAMISTSKSDPRFAEVEDVVVWQFRFPNGAIGHGSTSYTYAGTSRFGVQGTKGSLLLDPATDYYEHVLKITSEKDQRQLQLHERDQFALEMDYFSAAILNNTDVKTPGEEGLQDVRLMHAIYEAAKTERPVKIDWTYQRRVPV